MKYGKKVPILLLLLVGISSCRDRNIHQDICGYHKYGRTVRFPSAAGNPRYTRSALQVFEYNFEIFANVGRGSGYANPLFSPSVCQDIKETTSCVSYVKQRERNATVNLSILRLSSSDRSDISLTNSSRPLAVKISRRHKNLLSFLMFLTFLSSHESAARRRHPDKPRTLDFDYNIIIFKGFVLAYSHTQYR